MTLVVYGATSDDQAPAPATIIPLATSEVIPTAVGTADLDLSDSLYQPVAWDHPTHVNRMPPSSLDAAIKERPVHAAGWQFEGEPPVAFDLGAVDAEVCPPVPAEGRAQSGDWVLHAGAGGGPDAPSAAGQRRFVLFPIAPELLLDIADPQPLRIRAIDTANWEATHLIELMQPPAQSASGAWVYDIVLESPRTARWMALVTAGPLWGCFTLDLEQDPLRWPAPAALNLSWYPEPPADDDGNDDVLWSYVADGGLNQSASRVCVVATGQTATRSGQFAVGHLDGFGVAADGGFSPFMRSSKVIWLPQYQDALGGLTIRATLATDAPIEAATEPVHTYELIAAGSRVAAAAEFTYVTGPVLPRAGTWHIVATAAPYNLGCFTLTVGTG